MASAMCRQSASTNHYHSRLCRWGIHVVASSCLRALRSLRLELLLQASYHQPQYLDHHNQKDQKARRSEHSVEKRDLPAVRERKPSTGSCEEERGKANMAIVEEGLFTADLNKK